MLPVAQQRDDCGACSAFGVATTAASTSGSAASASQSVVTRGIAVPLGERAGRLLAMVRDGDELVAVREHAARMEVLDPPAAEQRDAGHAALSP